MTYSDIIKRVDSLIIDKLPTRFFTVKALWSEFVPFLVPDKFKTPITIHAYKRIPEFLSDEHNNLVFDWEKDVFEKYFKPAPAKILVAACGAGREMRYLAGKGYDVAGFDPVCQYVEKVHENIDSKKLICAEIADFSLFTKGLPLLDNQAPFDMGIAGWGSMVYLYNRAEQLETLKKIRRLVPAGYVLVSWIAKPEMSETRRKIHENSVFRKFMQRYEKTYYDTHLGLIHIFDEEEVINLAKASGFEIVKFDNALTRNYALLR